MAVTSGTKLGPYEIVTPLGAGGMGEVYLGGAGRLTVSQSKTATRVSRVRRYSVTGLRHPRWI